ncbi:hypothetical protein JOC94_002381 [Bacillus thermophilus]|uniref:Uncharacterized protein n=1 Tax=Siminovitchia thermophila TaxID=1245522 RepID=A0ABS2R715_9BACI|nr:hypothetical protein [Siminovitchia thermophila]
MDLSVERIFKATFFGSDEEEVMSHGNIIYLYVTKQTLAIFFCYF